MTVYTQTKSCSKCKAEKPLEEFCKRTRGLYGRNSRCRACCKEAYKQWRNSPQGEKAMTAYWASEKFKAYQKRWRNSPGGRASRARVRQSPGVKASQAKYWKTEKGKMTMARYGRANPQKKKAWAALNHALRDCHLPSITEMGCYKCGDTAGHWHHVNGYSESCRYDVVPMCRKCHYAAHCPL